jgi:hypothetical protein
MTELTVEPIPQPQPKTYEPKPMPENMKATCGWLLYKFAKEPNTEHLKSLALFMSQEIGSTLPDDQEAMDKLITSYMDEVAIAK